MPFDNFKIKGQLDPTVKAASPYLAIALEAYKNIVKLLGVKYQGSHKSAKGISTVELATIQQLRKDLINNLAEY